MSGKGVGTYLKRVELVEGSTEMMEILKAITVHDPWQCPYEADSPLRDYLRCYKRCLEQECATDCAQQTEEELLKRLPKAGYAKDIIKHELYCRWEKQFADARYDQLYAIASGDHPVYKTEWRGLHLDALEAETRTAARKLSLEAIHHRVANIRGSEPKKAALFDDLPPLNGTASRERIWGWSKPREATNATRKEGTG
ncbi:MAG: hypothetical protein EBZ48_15985 [Proteobacteria bacterium]|nr:hypothetical protein [Pseudomonadota bacterium]